MLYRPSQFRWFLRRFCETSNILGTISLKFLSTVTQISYKFRFGPIQVLIQWGLPNLHMTQRQPTHEEIVWWSDDPKENCGKINLYRHVAASEIEFNIEAQGFKISFTSIECRLWITNYCQLSNKRRTKSQNINVSRLVLQWSLLNPLKPGVKLRMKM